MQLWMDTRATYGNNPYQKEKQPVKRFRGGIRGSRMVAASRNKRPRSLFEVEENVELLTKQEDLAAMHNIIQEENVSRAREVSVTKQEDIVAVENMVEELNDNCNVVEDGLAHIDWEDQLGLAPPVQMEANTGTVQMVPVPTHTQVFSVTILEENLEGSQEPTFSPFLRFLT